MTYEALLSKLIDLRKRKKLSQGALADRLLVKRAIIGHREQGRSLAPLDELSEWAQALGAELQVELVTDGRRSVTRRLVESIQALPSERLELVTLLLRVLPHIDARDLRSIRLLLEAHEREIESTQATGAGRS